MFKLFKDTFKTATDGIILATPLVFFMCIISLYISYSKLVVDTIPEALLSSITMLFMFSAFCAGWFYMTKECVEFSKKTFITDKDKANAFLDLIKSFPTGIGKHFVNYIVVSLMFLAITLIIAYIFYAISLPFIKSIDFSLTQMSTLLNSPQDTMNFLNSLPQEQLISLFYLNITLMFIASIFSFLMMLWMPEIIYTKKNPFVALFTSIYKILSKFGKSLLLFLYITFVNFIISFLSTFTMTNTIAYMVMMLIYFYFIVYMVVLIFSYYDKEFNQTQNNSDSGSDS